MSKCDGTAQFDAIVTKVVLGLAAIFFIYDLTTDLVAGEKWSELALEASVFIFVLMALTWEIARRVRLTGTLGVCEQLLSRKQDQVGKNIRQQLDKWELTSSEVEIAWLIIKGYSFAEIAGFRGVKEKTVRQQATSIYAKSGTNNRAEFFASFLEDLLSTNISSPVAKARRPVLGLV